MARVPTVQALDRVVELRRKRWSSDNPYTLPPRIRWCQYPLFQQAWFEADLQSGVGVLPEKIEVSNG